MDTLTIVLAYLTGSTALLGAIAWIVKAALGHFANRDLESFKLKLASSANVELERLRADLKVVTATQERSGTLLVEKRAEVVAELYRRLVDLFIAAGSFCAIVELSGEPSKQEKAEALGKVTSEYLSYYRYNKIYFSADLCKKLDHVFESIHKPSIKFHVWSGMKDAGGDSYERYSNAWSDAWKAMEEEVPKVLSEIEDEFRKLLGHTENES